MKRNCFGFLAIVAVAFVLAGSMLAAPDAGRSVPVLSSRLESMTWYAPTEPIAIRFSLDNPGSESIWVLRWQMPSDDIDANILDISRDGVSVPYIGPLVKRAEPTPEDYLEIPAGESYTVEFDPSAVYDMTAQGQYTVRYRFQSLDVRTETPAGLPDGAGRWPAARPMMRAKVAETNPAEMWFEGLPPRDNPSIDPEDIPDSAQTRTIGGYTKCTTSQQSTLITAHNNAISISNKAKQHLAANPNGSTLYTYWFGTYASTRFSTVKTHYNAINDAFVTKSVTYDCSCKQNYYAYVYANKPYKIYVCKVFWSAPALGRDSKAGTLVHEMSHFYVTASTDDYVYGATGAHNLAVSNPAQAIDNADNHEYFAEDQP